VGSPFKRGNFLIFEFFCTRTKTSLFPKTSLHGTGWYNSSSRDSGAYADRSAVDLMTSQRQLQLQLFRQQQLQLFRKQQRDFQLSLQRSDFAGTVQRTGAATISVEELRRDMRKPHSESFGEDCTIGSTAADSWSAHHWSGGGIPSSRESAHHAQVGCLSLECLFCFFLYFFGFRIIESRLDPDFC
jgi:hypothetical protein